MRRANPVGLNYARSAVNGHERHFILEFQARGAIIIPTPGEMTNKACWFRKPKKILI